MRLVAGFLGVAVSCVLAGGLSAVRAEPDAAPYVTVRNIEKLQDRIATGDTIAAAAHAKAIARAARTFAAAKDGVWADPRNARALIVYLFSGGDAATIDKAIARNAIVKEYAALYDGALAYALADDGHARAALLPVDAKTLPTGLGGHLALVQATLTAATDAPKAIALLDLARLLEPGTLVEEAALRKEMSLIGAAGDLDKFALLARRYLHGFPRSVYVGNFRALMTQTARQIGEADSAEAAARLARLVAGLEPDERRRLYLTVARDAAVAGRTTMAAIAGEEAGRLARHGEPDEARSMVYFGAATIVGARYDVGLKALSDAEPTRLDARDQALRASALSVAHTIRGPALAGRDVDAATQEALLADGERSLASAARLLEEPAK